MTSRKRILCFFDYFYPAFKSGGPARSSLGLVDNLSSIFEFLVVTRDRDKEDRQPFQDTKIDQWIPFRGKSQVFYQSPSGWPKKLIGILKTTKIDYYYFNSFYSLRFTIVPLLIIQLFKSNDKIVIAPRGEFSPEALQISKFKKRIYRRLFKHFLLAKVVFHATANHEIEDIHNIYKNAVIRFAPNLRSFMGEKRSQYVPISKNAGELRIIFLSRISPMKNLDFALKVLAHSTSKITFTISGPIDDPDYWVKCQELINEMPENVMVDYHGAVDPLEVISTIQAYHLLFVPTRGENFGHIFLESLMASRPVLTSDKTPWTGLKKSNAGWAVDLRHQEKFVSLLDYIASLTSQEFEIYTKASFEFSAEFLKQQANFKNKYLKVFD